MKIYNDIPNIYLKLSEARRAVKVFLLGCHNENETALWGPALAGKYFESTYTTLHPALMLKQTRIFIHFPKAH